MEDGCKQNPSTVFIARGEDNRIVGFAAYDSYLSRKGYFGPMGVAKHARVKGLGRVLLLQCLRDMKKTAMNMPL
ncbi:GNAT family N-acetyltransferase [Bacillus sp. 1P06AnD]|uniref:GNAT family N-acetyltransferase n=1 Tax=Bacillus sp. 1P06AnD TaxID=3132208 RepID=UPI0039A02F3E